MLRYERRFRIPAGLDEVAKFHQNASALKRLTPPPVFVQIHRVEPLAENSLAEFTMWMGPFPIRWLARHVQVDPKTGFTDVQERGPFKSWLHRHRFTPVDDNSTEVLDEINAEPGSGFINGFVSRMMWISLPLLFAYRAWVTRKSIQKG